MRDNYHELCRQMGAMGWGSHAVLCIKHIEDPQFNRKGKAFCSAQNLKQLDIWTLYHRHVPTVDFFEDDGDLYLLLLPDDF